MHNHQLLDHPLFEERPINEVLEPVGFEIHLASEEPPIDPAVDTPEAIDAYANDPEAYIAALDFSHPSGFTEVYRAEDEDGDIISVAVRAKTVFAQLLLCADSLFAGDNKALGGSYVAVWRERVRQISTEGWSREHDDQHNNGEMAVAAGYYALVNGWPFERAGALGPGTPASPPPSWPWARKWWKPSTDPRRNLVKAGALILAEIERLDRKEGV